MRRWKITLNFEGGSIGTRPDIYAHNILDAIVQANNLGIKITELRGIEEISPAPRVGIGPVWAVGLERRPDEFGMIGGPYPDLQHALDFSPSRHFDENPCIIRFRGVTEVVTHRWKNDQWVKEG